MPYQPCYRTQNEDPTSFENHSTSKLNMPLPPSFQYAELLHLPCRPLPRQLSIGLRPTSAEVAAAPHDQIQGLRTLAQWPRLHHPTLPPPIVGDIESDPHGVADRYGVKGGSVLTAFINMDELSCQVCGFKANTPQLALLHQQRERHFQSL